MAAAAVHSANVDRADGGGLAPASAIRSPLHRDVYQPILELLPVGALERALDEAPARGWVVVDMQQDWNTVFLPERP